VNGILIIDKPEAMTSHDVIARVRRILGTRRVGHTGTLDPFATGVMVLLVGKATRLAQFLDKDEKEYEAVIQFGFETDTGDRTGKRNAECGVRSAEFDPADHDWERVFSRFRGEIMQTPPMYSAKKVEGKKLYELARKGIEITRQAVPVFIRNLDVLSHEFRAPHSALRIRVVCSAGTYIRTLAEDIGRAVGTGAHLAELRRTRAGRFSIDQAKTLDQLETANGPGAELIPITEAVSHLPDIVLTTERAARTRDGLFTRVDDAAYDDGAAVRMLDENREIIAIGIYNGDEKTVKPKIVLG
jgi:tRNA pseudouridine55 synthase